MGTVKVDIDAIIIPMRLRSYLEKMEVTDNGIYLENCKYVNYGFFGSLAVISHDAAATYMANIDDCKNTLNYTGHERTQAIRHGVRICSNSAAWRPEGEKKNRKWVPDCATVQTPGIHHFKKPE